MFNVTAEHSMVTENYGNPCSKLKSPFLNNCNVDAAGEILNFVTARSPLPSPKTTANPSSLQTFDQSRYVPGGSDPAGISLSDTVYAYIPEACNTQKNCSLHIALHGCEQTISQIGTTYIQHAGYLEWAEANNIVVLFPQAVEKSMVNPQGCFDWWGYTGSNYAKKSSSQLTTIMNMVSQLSN